MHSMVNGNNLWCAASAAVIIMCIDTRAVGFDIAGRVVDEKGRAIGNAEVTLWTQSGRMLRSTVTDATGRYRMSHPQLLVSRDGPLELMFEATGRHVKFVEQISGELSHDISVVLMPQDGPITYERVYDALSAYERLYYVIRAATTRSIIRGDEELRRRYGEKLLAIPNPDGNRVNDRDLRGRIRDDQRVMLRRKWRQVLELYGL